MNAPYANAIKIKIVFDSIYYSVINCYTTIIAKIGINGQPDNNPPNLRVISSEIALFDL